MRRLVLLSLLLCCLAFFGSVSKVDALGPGYQAAFERELKTIIDRHPRYQWGGSVNEDKGLDCSGYLFLAARRGGLPVKRTTAARMMVGEGGWIGVKVPFSAGTMLDLVGWTFRRRFDHIGILWHNRTVTHSSSRRGVVVDPMRGALKKTLSGIRHLTIGDTK